MGKKKIGKIVLPQGTQVERIKQSLAMLGLDASAETYDLLAEQAELKNATIHDFILTTLELQLIHNEENRVNRWIQQAKLMPLKTMQEYDFSLQPSVDPVLVNELMSCRYIEKGKNVILLGPPGVGKTHLAVALGHEAITQGYETRCMRLNEFIETIQKTADDALARLYKSLTSTKLLILDDIDYYTTTEESGRFLFDVVKQRHLLKASTIITSNKNPKDWGNLFGSNRTEAALDRLFDRQRAVIINISGGQSYRVPKPLETFSKTTSSVPSDSKPIVKKIAHAFSKK